MFFGRQRRICLVVAASFWAGSITAQPVIVPLDTLRAVMGREVAKPYDEGKMTNSGRFFSGVNLELTRRAHAIDPTGEPLLIQHDDWFRAYLESTGLRWDEAPIGQRLGYEHSQDFLIDYNRNRIFAPGGDQRSVDAAANIQISWPTDLHEYESYSFEDTTTGPHIQVTNHHVIRFRLLDLGDMIVFDEMTGITGRPSTGILATIFEVIGEGHLNWSRMAVSPDGLLITRSHSSKGPFSVTETVTVYPDGRGVHGLPSEDPAYEDIEEDLKRDLDIEYVDWE